MTMNATRMANGIVDDMVTAGVVLSVAQEAAMRVSLIGFAQGIIDEIDVYYSGTSAISHAALDAASLVWADSGHTGTGGATTMAGFDATGAAIEGTSSDIRTWLSIANVENTALSTWTGSTSVVTLGTITAGTWCGATVTEGYGGTGQTTYALGDTLHASATDTLSKLAGNTTTTRKFYRQTGDGAGHSAAPAWDTVTATDVGLGSVENAAASGLYLAKSTYATLADIVYATGAGTYTVLAGDVSNTRKFIRELSVGGVATAPVWDTVTKADVGLGSVENAAASTLYVAKTAYASIGALVYADGPASYATLAGDTSNVRHFLRELSVAGVATAPVWDAVTKGDVGLGSVENTALSTWAGTSNVITVGTITAGTWHGTAIADTYIASAATWNALVGISDGDKGDITVSSSGLTWTIDAGVVTLSKMANMASASILGRKTAGAGAPEVLSASNAKTILSLSTTDNPQFASLGVGGAAPTTTTGRILAATGLTVGATTATTYDWASLGNWISGLGGATWYPVGEVYNLCNIVYYAGAWHYVANGYGSVMYQSAANGNFLFGSFASGLAGNVATLVYRLQVTNAGHWLPYTTGAYDFGDGTHAFRDLYLSGVIKNGATVYTMPGTTSTLATLALAETLTNKTLTTPDINGGTADALTSLGIRSTGAAHDLRFAITEAIAADRTITLTVGAADRTIGLAGNLSIAGDFSTSGAYACVLTLTGATNVTVPTTGTLATTAQLTGRYLGSFVATGTTYTTGADTHTIVVRMVGGGGGGGGVINGAAGTAAAGGGSAGSYAEKTFAVAPSTGYTIQIGAAGAGGAAGTGYAGTNGTASTFAVGATTVTAPGGVGAGVGTPNANPTVNLGGSSGGISTNGDVNSAGEPGLPGITIVVAAVTVASGNGGSSPFGAGGKGTNGGAAGGNALGHGAGGGGAAGIAAVPRAGGAATAGFITVDEYS